MTAGDFVFYYHSGEEKSAVRGLARVAREGYPDPTGPEEGVTGRR